MKILKEEKKWLLKEKYGVNSESVLEKRKSKDFFSDLKKLKKGEPLAYVIGFVEFLNCKIDLNFKPLIPRPETEFWVENFIKEELKEIKIQNHQNLKILDIFSGSGCIGISILKKFQNINIDFVDINPDFIKQIEKNIKINNLENKNFKIFQSNIFKNIPPKNKYHFILANPPYIPKNKKISSSVLNFEDHNSLFANDDGLYFIKKTIKEGIEKIENNGKIFIEFDENSRPGIEKFLKEKNLKNYQFKKDQFQNDRLLIIQK